MAITRRSSLDATGRAVTAAAVARLLPFGGVAAQDLDSRRLTVHSARPQDIETPPHLLTSWITPNDLFYVRSEEIKSLPRRTTVVTLECAGNGRAFFEPPVAGVQWGRGAVGTAAWTGVRLADLLARARVKSTGRHVWLDGADRGLGRAPDFVRNVPIEKALDPETLLALGSHELPAGEGAAVARARCLTCHGAAVQDAERQPLLDYLATHVGQALPPPRLSAEAEEAGAAIVRSRCTTCHDTAMLEQQR